MHRLARTAFTLCLLAAPPAAAQEPIDIPYTKYVLDNGLRLIVHEDHKAPIAAVNVWYDVGAADEEPGKTGFAHLFEHLMFNGSEHYVLPHLRMLPAILRMIVPAVSDQSRAGGTHDREPAARRFTLDRKHAAARGVLRSRVRQSAASRESSWTAGTPPSKPGRKAHNCYRSRGAGGVLPVDAALDAALPTVGHLTMHHQLHPFTRPLPAGSSRGRTGVRGVPRSVT